MFALISNIQHFSIQDGPGIRTTLFFQGCPLKCWWCHNPECIEFNTTSTGAAKYSAEELMEIIRKDKIFYEQSDGGVTFSGGEPFSQPEFLKLLIEKCKSENIHTTIDTSGYVPSEVLKEFVNIPELFLYDLKLIDDLEHKKFTGVSNKQILDNLRLLDSQNQKILIRVPVISGVTDTVWNINEIIKFLQSLNNKYDIELLPYHRIAEGKYDRLGMEYKLKGRIYKGKTEDIIELFRNNGFKVL